jgi:hypothetical protein
MALTSAAGRRPRRASPRDQHPQHHPSESIAAAVERHGAAHCSGGGRRSPPDQAALVFRGARVELRDCPVLSLTLPSAQTTRCAGRRRVDHPSAPPTRPSACRYESAAQTCVATVATRPAAAGGPRRRPRGRLHDRAPLEGLEDQVMHAEVPSRSRAVGMFCWETRAAMSASGAAPPDLLAPCRLLHRHGLEPPPGARTRPGPRGRARNTCASLRARAAARGRTCPSVRQVGRHGGLETIPRPRRSQFVMRTDRWCGPGGLPGRGRGIGCRPGAGRAAGRGREGPGAPGGGINGLAGKPMPPPTTALRLPRRESRPRGRDGLEKTTPAPRLAARYDPGALGGQERSLVGKQVSSSPTSRRLGSCRDGPGLRRHQPLIDNRVAIKVLKPSISTTRAEGAHPRRGSRRHKIGTRTSWTSSPSAALPTARTTS